MRIKCKFVDKKYVVMPRALESGKGEKTETGKEGEKEKNEQKF